MNNDNKCRNNNFYKIIYYSVLVIFYSFILTCDKPEETEIDKTYIEFSNPTVFDVNVFRFSPPSSSNSEPSFFVPKNSNKLLIETDPSATSAGDPFYYQYLIPVGSIRIPFNSPAVEYYQIKKEIINALNIPVIASTNTNTSFLVVENNSNSIINVQYFITLEPHSGQSVTEIQAGESAVYILRNNATSLTNYSVGTHINRREFPQTIIEPGIIYSFKYDPASISLYSKSPFDIYAQRNIWTIPTFDLPAPPNGNFFTVGLLSSRANVETAGYILAGSVNYNHSTVKLPHVGAVPYLGRISPIGGIDPNTEGRITIKSNPAGLNLKSFIEDINELIFVGQAYFEDTTGRPCILSTNTNLLENYYYQDFINDINDNQEIYGEKLVKWDNANYAFGCQIRDLDRQLSQVYIAKVTKVRWDEVTHEEFWRSPENDNASLIDLKYVNNMLVVLADTGTGSIVYFINANNGNLISSTGKSLDNYWINGIFNVGDDYYAAGGYKGVSRDRGFLTNIDVATGNVNITNPSLIDPAKFLHGAGSFLHVMPENDGSLILAGWCVEDNSNVNSSEFYMPWLVKYDPIKREKIWEQVYENNKGYYINSVHHNAIGSYLLEIHNEKTYHSYLISTDLLGKITDNILPRLPRHPTRFIATQPGNPGISVNIVPMPDASLTTPTAITLTKGQTGSITVQQGIWTSCEWYVNGILVTNSGFNYTFTTLDRNVGVYNVTAVVKDSAGERRSASCRVTVIN
ncbi:MAG: hypothetical protein FWD13_03470 [Treponema sp.]|nr:hypothetical protein [Treponema sp.]